MTNHIFWLSSYPKSGNTLIRSILISLFFTENGEFKIENFYKIKQFDICKLAYENKKLFGKNFLKIKNIEIFYQYLLELQTREKLKLNENNFMFLKTHSGLFNILDNPFTTEENTLGFFYIIRDPRDVCISWSKHTGLSIDESIKFMLNENSLLHWKESSNKKNYFINENRPRSYVSSWDRHVISWTQVNWRKPYKVFRFEDLVYEKKDTTFKIINFFEEIYNFKFTNKEEKISNIIKTTDFKKLKNDETKKGFIEATKFSNFFSEGRKEQWKKILNKKQLEKIERKFCKTMKKFNYQLSII